MPSVYTITTPKTGSTGRESTGFQTYPGGVGYNMTGPAVYNDSTITGGLGGPGAYRVVGGSGYTTNGGMGGAGVVLSAGTFTNDDVVRGGAGGYGTATGGTGGVGVRLTGTGAVINDGRIYGGAGGYGTSGGYSPGAPGNGGAGVYLSGGTLTTKGLIEGGAGGTNPNDVDGSVGDAVQFGAAASTLIVDSGATFVGQVAANSSVTDTLELAGGGNDGTGITLGTQFTGFSTLDFASGAKGWTVDATVAALQTHAPSQSDFAVDGFSLDETIGIAGASGATLQFDSTTEVLTLTESGGTEVNLQFDSPFNGEHFVLKGQDLQLAAGACFLSGTRIRCQHGEVAIESLQIGDRVMTAAGTLQPVRWIGRRRHAAEEAFANRAILPVRIRAGALGSEVPARDLWVSPEHAMYIDAMLIPAGALVNGTSIVQEEISGPVSYLHLEFDSHTIIYAEGALSESFVDDDSRLMFDNALEYHVLYPGAAAVRARFCAPRVEEGEELERVRRSLSRQTGSVADSLTCLAATERPAFESARS